MFKKTRQHAAKFLNVQQKALQEIGRTGRRIAKKHTPYGVVKSTAGLISDRMALTKSKKGLANVRAQAANKLRQINTRRKKEKANVLSSSQIKTIKQNESLSDAQKNSLFERDMRLRRRLKLPQ